MEFRMKTECPNEEILVDYLEGRLAGVEKSRVEDHLSFCDNCLEEVSAVYSIMQDGDSFEFMEVPTEVTLSAMELTFYKKNKFLLFLKEKLYHFIRNLKFKLSDFGMIFWTEWQLVPVRSSRVVLAKNHSRRRKDFNEIETDIEIEKIGDNLAQIRVVLNKDQSIGRELRVTLIRRKRRGGVTAAILDREIASYIIEDGYVLFENIPFDHYKLTYTRDGVTLGRYLFQIK